MINNKPEEDNRVMEKPHDELFYFLEALLVWILIVCYDYYR